MSRRPGPCLPWLPWFSTAVVASAIAGCGLTLDYDPPGDAGADAPFDARRVDAPMPDAPSEVDAGDPCGGCADGAICRGGACIEACGVGAPCSDTSACEACVEGGCVAVDLTCEGASACLTGACNPATDACEYSDTCGAGMACSSGTCVPGSCTADLDCEALVGGCGYFCDVDTCRPRVPRVCPPISGASCELIDECTCAGTGVADATLCNAGAVCDASAFLCVQCVGDGDCLARGLPPRCDPRTRSCVECIHDSDCSGGQRCNVGSRSCVDCLTSTDCPVSAPACDVLSSTCVACLRSTDCDAGQVCDLAMRVCVGCLDSRTCASTAPVCDPTSRTCRACVVGASGECPIGQICERGACVPAGCRTAADCPIYPCAANAACMTTAGGNVCVYGGLNSDACNDLVDCTSDVCDPMRSTDGSGCVHTPISGSCNDGIGCTYDLCRISRGPGDVAGCVNVPNDPFCASGTSLECAQRLCVATEPGAVFDASTGCGLSYDPFLCPPGSYCDAAGQCQGLPGCGSGVGCPSIASACLAPLICVGDQCLPLDDGSTSVCDVLPACAAYCGASGCAARSGSVVCGVTTTP